MRRTLLFLGYYSFVRNAYVQRRNALLHDNLDSNVGDGDALYHPELQEE